MALHEINARRKAKDPTVPKISLAYVPIWDSFVYVKVRSLSDPRVKTLELQYGELIYVDDGSNPRGFGVPGDAW